MIISLDQLLAAISQESKPYLQPSGFSKNAFYRARAGARIGKDTAQHFLNKARELFGPEVVGLRTADGTIFAPEALDCLSARITTLEAEVRQLRARVTAHESRLFRRLVGEARLNGRN